MYPHTAITRVDGLFAVFMCSFVCVCSASCGCSLRACVHCALVARAGSHGGSAGRNETYASVSCLWDGPSRCHPNTNQRFVTARQHIDNTDQENNTNRQKTMEINTASKSVSKIISFSVFAYFYYFFIWGILILWFSIFIPSWAAFDHVTLCW